MDEHRFDNVARALAERGARRGVLGMLAGGVLGALVSLQAKDAPAKPKKKGKKKACPKKPCPRGFQRNKRTCKCECVRTPCSGGKEFDTKECRCACPRDLRECRDGCIGPNECCPSDPPCPEDAKGCCYSPGVEVCTIDGCCLELDGRKACNNFCVDTNTDRRNCGACNRTCDFNEVCVNGDCRPESQCPGNQVPCPGERGPFCAPEGHTCCGDSSCNAFNECCNAAEDRCCLKGRCTEGRCCPENREICAGKCCAVGEICCGTECCSASACVNGTCCPTGACGAVDASNRVCVAEGEVCCFTGADNSGYACPDVEYGGSCAVRGQCCPEGTFYSPSCGKCCSDIRDLCDQCVPTFAGRF